MSRPDTSAFFKIPYTNAAEEDLKEAQTQALIAERGAQVQNQLAQAEERKRQADKLRQDNEEKRRTYNAQEGARAYIQDARARGLPTPSMDDLIGRFGNDAMPFLTAMTARDKEDLANQKERSDNYIKLHGAMIDALSLEPDESKHQEIERTVYQRAVQQGLITTNEANQYLQQPPDKLDQLEASRKAEQRKNDELKAASERNFKDAETLKNAAQTTQAQAETHRKELENARIEQGQPPVPVAAPQPQAPMSPERFQQQKELEQMKLNASQGEAVQLSPAGLDVAAAMFAKTGQLPPMGMGKAGAAVRSKIINRAAELNPNLDLATNKAEFKANETSLTALQKNRDAVVAFENTASKNLDLFVTQAQKVVDSGSPWINQPLRAVQQRGLGSADLAAFNTARQVAINEIAKVTSSPGLSGTLSDSARHEVEAFIPENATLAQVLAVAKTLRTDMKNRHESLDEQIGAIQKRIGGGGKGGGGSTRMTATNPQTKEQVESLDGGKTWQPIKK